MLHTLIVPGVGGSEYDHWQSWLQRQLVSCSRVEQQNWHHPQLSIWLEQFVQVARSIDTPLQIVAHSFGCLTSIAALATYPEIAQRVQNMILVAPANPNRFGENGFAEHGKNHYLAYFKQLSITVPTTLLISENDPWLDFTQAKNLAHAWNLTPINLGAVGHINVASGFGPFPQIFDYLISENTMSHMSITDDDKHFFKFAI